METTRLFTCLPSSPRSVLGILVLWPVVQGHRCPDLLGVADASGRCGTGTVWSGLLACNFEVPSQFTHSAPLALIFLSHVLQQH